MDAINDSRAMPEHHQHLGRVFDALVAKAYEGDPVALRAQWDSFERELLQHLEVEEKDLFPGFAREHPAEAAALRSDHAYIRAALTELAINLDLHALRAAAVESFVALLERHAQQEDRVLYPWAEQHPPPHGWQAIKERLRSSILAHGIAP